MLRRLFPLLLAVIILTVVVLSLVGWAVFSGEAGSQRGLTVRSAMNQPITVRFESGDAATLTPGDREHTFVVVREQYPQTLTAVGEGGDTIVAQQIAYAQLAEADFRISIDRNGFYPTTAVRTPAPD